MITERIQASFGRRRGRKLGPKVEAVYNYALPKLSLKKVPARLEDLFQDTVEEVWLEIGFGGGEHILAQLEANPKLGIIGSEPYMNGVARLLSSLNEKYYGRIRIWQDDVRLILADMPKEQLDRVYVLFPDPWPKKRHLERRLIDEEFRDELIPLLKKGGELRMGTDFHDYAEQMLDVMGSSDVFEVAIMKEHPLDWPITRYEAKALNIGTPCVYYIFRKK